LVDDAIVCGWAQLLRGNLAQSRTAYREAISLAAASNDPMRLGRSVCGAAGLAAAAGEATHAARLFGAAARQRDDEQVQLKPSIQAELDQLTTTVREGLGEAHFAAAWAAGGLLQLEDAVAEAQVVLAEDWRPDQAGPRTTRPQPARATALGTHLTPREWQVLRVLVAGRSDKDIAAELSISHRTASGHVAAIIAKLGVSSRTAAAIAAHDLLD
jgi:DNA-binding CsgD family transcriptional regulator